MNSDAGNPTGNFEGNAKLSTWLHRIVVNAALMKLRTRKRKPEQSIESMLPSFLDDGHHEAGRQLQARRVDAPAVADLDKSPELVDRKDMFDAI